MTDDQFRLRLITALESISDRLTNIDSELGNIAEHIAEHNQLLENMTYKPHTDGDARVLRVDKEYG